MSNSGCLNLNDCHTLFAKGGMKNRPRYQPIPKTEELVQLEHTFQKKKKKVLSRAGRKGGRRVFLGMKNEKKRNGKLSEEDVYS